jgi:4-amino-4-deoxychorismate lyase
MSNVFLVRRASGDPRLARCGVIGRAARARARAALGRRRECRERDIASRSSCAADEVFLTNSLIGAWPCAALGERRWPGARHAPRAGLIEVTTRVGR